MVFGAWARHTSMLIKVQAGELLGATISLFYVSLRKNSRPEGGAFIRSLQTGFLGKKVDEQIEADYNSVDEAGADPGFFLGGGALVSCST